VLTDTTQIALKRAIQGASLRQTALSANLANANTPGYRRMDVDFHSVISTALGDPEKVQRAGFAATADSSAPVVRADGSTVDVDSESAKLAANALEHQTLVAVASGRGDIVKIALGVK
jgi:flagellar basal-body rod protein FlgB